MEQGCASVLPALRLVSPLCLCAQVTGAAEREEGDAAASSVDVRHWENWSLPDCAVLWGWDAGRARLVMPLTRSSGIHNCRHISLQSNTPPC